MKLDIKDFITTELCPHCNSEVEIMAKGISECPVCHKPILPCSMCDDCDYNHCPYGNKHHDAKIEDINICSVEIIKDILDQFNKNYSIICISLLNGNYITEEELNESVIYDDQDARSLEIEETDNQYELYLSISPKEFDYFLDGKSNLDSNLSSSYCSIDMYELAKEVYKLIKFNKEVTRGGPRFEIIETSDAFKEPYVIFDRETQDYYVCDEIIQTFDTYNEAEKYCFELNQKYNE